MIVERAVAELSRAWGTTPEQTRLRLLGDAGPLPISLVAHVDGDVIDAECSAGDWHHAFDLAYPVHAAWLEHVAASHE